MPEHRQSSPAIADSALTPEQIARLRQLHEAGTPPPWQYGIGPYGRDIEANGELIAEVIAEDGKPRSRDDATLITEARNALPALLAEVERLRKRLAAEERNHHDTIGQRDRAEEWADQLASLLAPADVLGEHSNANNRWVNAAAFARTPVADVDASTDTPPSPTRDQVRAAIERAIHGAGVMRSHTRDSDFDAAADAVMSLFAPSVSTEGETP